MNLLGKELLIAAVCMVLIASNVDAKTGEAREEGLLKIILRELIEEKLKRVRNFH